MVQRYELQLLDADQPHELVKAVLPAAGRPARGDALLDTLARVLADDQGRAIVTAVQRVLRILPSDPIPQAAAPTAPEPADLELDRVVTVIEAQMSGVAESMRLDRFFEVATELPAAVDHFFTDVQVIHPDPAIRAARLGLLRRVADVAGTEIDWAAIG